MMFVIYVRHEEQMAYTEGLLYGGNDTLFESTGLFGESSVRKVDLQTGMVEELQKMDDSLFGEGLTLLGERLVSVMLTGPAYDQWPMENLTVFQLKLLFQLTWSQKIGFIYDQKNLSRLGTFNHDMKEGWGLATDGKVLFGSDGSSTLYQMDPQTFKAVSKQVVCYKGHQVQLLNELEYVNGEIWANVYMTDCIVRISPNDGGVLGWILLQNLREELLEEGNIGIEVLNGIAWDGEQKRIFVTGKLWPKLYEVNVFPTKEPIEEGVIEQLCLPIIF
ncbi:putative glutaminyl-peptide cyclotransferase [Lupinus albus]|uniref:Putative glutaminyl-peptide cyclotransferase n=1 Tax=Lupinus albus TaxID=3870 RepID=A0A6A4P1R7_LUPAL|nr:putative glutaminyl-peptide cyclotransferase [Lupinus albus]